MSDLLTCKLPDVIIDVIKLYTGEGCWRRGEYINIHKIPKDDSRYTILSKRPIIKQIYNTHPSISRKGSVWYKLDNGKFIVINVGKQYIWNGTRYINDYFWEMHYDKKNSVYYIL
jgi:hypothetical protein